MGRRGVDGERHCAAAHRCCDTRQPPSLPSLRFVVCLDRCSCVPTSGKEHEEANCASLFYGAGAVGRRPCSSRLLGVFGVSIVSLIHHLLTLGALPPAAAAAAKRSQQRPAALTVVSLARSSLPSPYTHTHMHACILPLPPARRRGSVRDHRVDKICSYLSFPRLRSPPQPPFPSPRTS